MLPRPIHSEYNAVGHNLCFWFRTTAVQGAEQQLDFDGDGLDLVPRTVTF